MTRRPLLAVGLVGTLLGGIVSGCSDGGTAVNSAAPASSAASSADSTAVTAPAQKQAAAKVVNPAPAVAAGSDDFASVWGPAVGSTIPILAANDHTGAAQNLESLSGDKGLLLVFSRSADW